MADIAARLWEGTPWVLRREVNLVIWLARDGVRVGGETAVGGGGVERWRGEEGERREEGRREAETARLRREELQGG